MATAQPQTQCPPKKHGFLHNLPSPLVASFARPPPSGGLLKRPDGIPSATTLLLTLTQDLVFLARLLLDPVGLAEELDQLYSRNGFRWLWQGIHDDATRFEIVLDDAWCTLCTRWTVVLAPLGIKVSAIALLVLVRLLRGDDGSDGRAAWMHVGDLGPMGVSLSDLAGWTKEVL